MPFFLAGDSKKVHHDAIGLTFLSEAVGGQEVFEANLNMMHHFRNAKPNVIHYWNQILDICFSYKIILIVFVLWWNFLPSKSSLKIFFFKWNALRQSMCHESAMFQTFLDINWHFTAKIWPSGEKCFGSFRYYQSIQALILCVDQAKA